MMYDIDFDDFDLAAYQMRQRPWPKWWPQEGHFFGTREEAEEMLRRCTAELDTRAEYRNREYGDKLFRFRTDGSAYLDGEEYDPAWGGLSIIDM